MTEASDALLSGDPNEAEFFANQTLQIGNDSGQPDALALYGAQLVGVRHQQGRAGELVSVIEHIVAENPGLPIFKAALSVALLDSGDERGALNFTNALVRDGIESVPEDINWLDTLLWYAEPAIELHVDALLEQLLDVLSPFHTHVAYEHGVLPHDPIAFYLGSFAAALGNYDDADSHLVEATELNARGHLKFSKARTQLAWARMLACRQGPGDLERASYLLEEAHSSAITHGYGMVERRAAAELAKLG